MSSSSNKPRRDLTSLENVIVGGISGTVEVLIQQPAVSWKNALQERRPLSFNPRIMYRGVVINASSIAPITSVQFAVNGLLASALGSPARTLSDPERLGVAAIAGAASALVSTPAELIMIQQQRTGNSLAATARFVTGNFGYSILYKAFLPTAIRESLFTCGYLGLGPVLKEQLMSAFPSTFGDRPLTAAALGSIAAGLLAAALTQPADTVKTRMQGDVRGAETVYKTPLQSAGVLASKEGFKVFFSGLIPRGLRMIGAVFILGRSKEVLTDIIMKDE